MEYTPSYRKEYPTTLGEIEPGRPFFMLDYDGLFMRVKSAIDFEFIEKSSSEIAEAVWERRWSFNVRGNHLPIVNLTTGELTHISKEKPVRVY